MNVSHHPLISIIVPLYNMEKYFSQCIDSIKSQTYKDFEVIIVDDGSTDKSGEIADQWAFEDKRVKVIHQSNKGLAYVRNVGISMSKAEYIIFIDSDDWVKSDYVEKLYYAAKQHVADIVIGNYIFTWDKPYKEKYSKIDEHPVEYNKTQAIKELLYNKKIKSYMWGSIYKSELFRDVMFPVGRVYEDYARVFNVFDKAERVVVIPDHLYFYRQVNTSIVNLKKYKSDVDYMLALIDRVEFSQKCDSLTRTEKIRFKIKSEKRLLLRYSRLLKDYSADQLNSDNLKFFDKKLRTFFGLHKFTRSRISLYLFMSYIKHIRFL